MSGRGAPQTVGMQPANSRPVTAAALRRALIAGARRVIASREQLNRILAERTGQPLEKIQNDTERDYYMSAAEAQTYGLIDQVIAKRG